MPSLNSVSIIGNCGSDPEMRFTPNGKPVTSFRVAVNRVYTDKDGNRKEETEWVSIVTWNKSAENCNKYLSKGSLVFCEGRLKTRMWEKDGEKHYRTEVIANRVLFLDKKGDKQGDKATTEDPSDNAVEPEDLPFS
jgi:single-strand DNA-binding protein